MFLYEDLLQIALRTLFLDNDTHLSKGEIGRAVSTIYYSVFHAACQNTADCIVGNSEKARNDPAWLQSYRAVEHGYLKNQCLNIAKMDRFSENIQNFGQTVPILQGSRHKADYDPTCDINLNDAQHLANTAKIAIEDLFHAHVDERRSFAVWISMPHRK